MKLGLTVDMAMKHTTPTMPVKNGLKSDIKAMCRYCIDIVDENPA